MSLSEDDQIIDTLRQQIPSFACVPGCHDCCGPVTASSTEMARLPRRSAAVQDAALEALDYDLLFLTSALTAVDYCETHADEAHAVNAAGPGRIAEISARKGAHVTYISTDMVFDGLKPAPVDGQSATGERNPLVLAAAYLAGVTRVFTLGGAQAVAALAYGTASLPAVDKITGPGNIYVAIAKKLVFGDVGIDMIAGPSELTIICDGGTNPDWIAMDLFSQAEHDEQAQSILISDDAQYLQNVMESIERLLPTMSRREIIGKSLRDRGMFILTQSLSEAAAVSNQIAPEHLELSVADPQALAAHITHAGALFMGRYSAEALGDYCAGPSHVLPTSGTARFFSALGVYDFQKRTSIIQCSAQGASHLAGIAQELATNEFLQAHAESAAYRR